MAQEIAFNQAGIEQRITQGTNLVAEIEQVRTDLSSVATAVNVQLVGQWGQAHQVASGDVDNALRNLESAMNDRNTFLSNYLKATYDTDANNQGKTNSAGAAVGSITASLKG